VTDLTVNQGITLTGSSILILGAGGASRGIIGPLLDLAPKNLVIANRSVEKAVALAEQYAGAAVISGCAFADLSGQQFDLILNATSASLTDELPPLPEGILASNGNCYDLAYGNQATAFVRWGQANAAVKSLDGLGMLVEQAAAAFFIWRGVKPQTKPVIDLLNSERFRTDL
ncbi:MAG: shikimate dehydrogenase, partial [Methylococcales bacterium]